MEKKIVFSFKINSQFIPRIIGKKGNKINEIQANSSTIIKIFKNCYVNITGNEYEIELAKKMIDEIINNKLKKSSSLKKIFISELKIIVNAEISYKNINDYYVYFKIYNGPLISTQYGKEFYYAKLEKSEKKSNYEIYDLTNESKERIFYHRILENLSEKKNYYEIYDHTNESKEKIFYPRILENLEGSLYLKKLAFIDIKKSLELCEQLLNKNFYFLRIIIQLNKFLFEPFNNEVKLIEKQYSLEDFLQKNHNKKFSNTCVHKDIFIKMLNNFLKNNDFFHEKINKNSISLHLEDKNKKKIVLKVILESEKKEIIPVKSTEKKILSFVNFNQFFLNETNIPDYRLVFLEKINKTKQNIDLFQFIEYDWESNNFEFNNENYSLIHFRNKFKNTFLSNDKSFKISLFELKDEKLGDTFEIEFENINYRKHLKDKKMIVKSVMDLIEFTQKTIKNLN